MLSEKLTEKGEKLLEALRECIIAQYDYITELEDAIENEIDIKAAEMYASEFPLISTKYQDIGNMILKFSITEINFIKKYKTNLFSGKDQ